MTNTFEFINNTKSDTGIKVFTKTVGTDELRELTNIVNNFFNEVDSYCKTNDYTILQVFKTPTVNPISGDNTYWRYFTDIMVVLGKK